MKKASKKLDTEQRMKVLYCPKSRRREFGNWIEKHGADNPKYRCCKCGLEHD